MKVAELVQQADNAERKAVSVTGLLVNYQDHVFLVDDDVSDNALRIDEVSSDYRENGVRVASHAEFGIKFARVVPMLIGDLFYHERATVIGVIGPSSVDPFPIEFKELMDVVVHVDGKDYRLAF